MVEPTTASGDGDDNESSPLGKDVEIGGAVADTDIVQPASAAPCRDDTGTVDAAPAAAEVAAFPFAHVVITFPDVTAARAADGGGSVAGLPPRSIHPAGGASAAATATATTNATDTGPLDALRRRYPTATFTATADPWGARVGSGGGTVAALFDHAVPSSKDDDTNKDRNGSRRESTTTLVLHAGGAASRVPTQICLGKAWTSLPTTRGNNNNENCSSTTSSLTTPLAIWLDLCHSLFRTLPPDDGACVVIASDTLLQLDAQSRRLAEGIDWATVLNKNDDADDTGSSSSSTTDGGGGGCGGVVCLAVPTPLETARNHGVFVLATANNANAAVHTVHEDSTATTTTVTPSSKVAVCDCQKVLQKPSLVELTAIVSASDPDNSNNYNTNRMVWIDTGITILSAAVVSTLRSLCENNTLQRCTATGLRALCVQQQLQEQSSNRTRYASTSISLPAFASTESLSVDLYTHMLQALSLSNNDADDAKSQYLAKYNAALPGVAAQLFDALHPHRLRILTVLEGRFWHLGTSQELRTFLVNGVATTTATEAIASQQQQQHALGKQLGLIRRCSAYTTLGGRWDGTSCVHASAVILHSLVTQRGGRVRRPGENDAYVGAGTVLEHCRVRTMQDGKIQIGERCLVSGLRTPEHEPRVCIPNDTMVLMVQAVQPPRTYAPSLTSSYVIVVVLGMDDSIKQRETVYGVSFQDFLLRGRLKESDLWVYGEEKNVWTARLHPVVTTDQSFSSIFSWLTLLDNKTDISQDPSFLGWKMSHRISLQQLRAVSHAEGEFDYRKKLAKHFQEFKVSYDESLCHMIRIRLYGIPLDFQFLVDACAAGDPSAVSNIIRTLHGVDRVIVEASSMEGSRYIMARACMIISLLLHDLLINSADQRRESEHVSEYSTSIAAATSSCFDNLRAKEGNIISDLANLSKLRDGAISTNDSHQLMKLSKAMEDVSGALVGSCVCDAASSMNGSCSAKPIHDQWILAKAPARVDLSGGWSDTPPICYDHGAFVTGIAVLIDDHMPLACRCRVSTGKGIFLCAESRSLNGALASSVTSELAAFSDLSDYRDPTADNSLLKCVLVHLGFLSSFESNNGSEADGFQTALNAFCGAVDDDSTRLEIIATSLLPHGSGLGTSSILAGCVLSAIAQCIGLEFTGAKKYEHAIIECVSAVEQLSSCGGGFQDQVNGLLRGIKSVSSAEKVHPLQLSIENLDLDDEFRNELDSRLILVFTGKTRLAKNLLRNVLRRWSMQTPEIVQAMKDLVEGAKDCRDAVLSEDLTTIGACMSDYWTQKKIMAGPTSGVEPIVVHDVFRELQRCSLISGGTLCGAGGGGFMVLLSAPGISLSDIQEALNSSSELSPPIRKEIESFMWHSCKTSASGLSTFPLPTTEEDVTFEQFELSWLKVSS